MAQKTKSKRSKRTPVYSDDSLTIRLILGVILIGLGLMIFLSVVLLMPGNVFAGLRQVIHGLCGSLSFLMPVLPIWGGVLVLLSTRRHPPVMPFLMACLLYVLLMAATIFLTFSGNPSMPLMEYILRENRTHMTSPGTLNAFLSWAFDRGVSRCDAGGLLGMLLAWPLWKLLGVVGGAIVTLLLTVCAALLMCRVTPAKIQAFLGRLRASGDARRQQRMQEQREQELRWQQEQAWNRQQQEAMRQQAWEQSMARSQPPAEPVYTPYPAQGYPTAPSGAYAPSWNTPQPAQDNAWMGASAAPAQDDSWMASSAPMPYAPPVQTPAPAMDDAPAASGFAASPSAATYSLSGHIPPLEPLSQEPAPRKRKGIFDGIAPTVDALAAGIKKRKGIFDSHEAEDTPESAPAPAKRKRILDDAPSADAPPVPLSGSDRPSAPAKRGVIRPEASAIPPEAAMTPPPDVAPVPQDDWEDTLPPWEEEPEQAAEPVAARPLSRPAKTQDAPSRASLSSTPAPKPAPAPAAPPMDMPYVYPTMDLLSMPKPQAGINAEEDALRTRRLEEMLQSFRIPAKVRHITHGPTISRFELELAPGINVTKVMALSKNIAMNMEATTVRIEAPIPGTPLVGVEIPNAVKSTVTLREVLDSEAMHKATKPLIVALGKDIAGAPILCDLAKMPHLLIAGATGAGKSVCINTIINSLLYRCSPKDVRLILIDPKVVELQCYNGIPHLLIPVVSDPHKASGALAWAVGEMTDRYKRFERKHVRNIDGYNALLEEGEEPVPRIVIIIDELADLMMTCKKDVEDRICRLAQLARAAGLHLIVATQRPSVDVITGLIKANINSRISFKVNSNVDSRTILDRVGAENLLGNGDMLYKPMTEGSPIRVQGCFLTDEEVNRITTFISERNVATYDDHVLSELEHLQAESESAAAPEMADSGDNACDSDQELLAQAIEMAVNSGQLSTSHLQRRLKVGYARAGRLMDEMEERGIVSAKDGTKPRRCLISREEFEQMRDNGALREL